MRRKTKLSLEEKISAVEDYLNGIIAVSEIMTDLSIRIASAVINWILAYQHGGIQSLCPVSRNHSYSKEFKIEMIQSYFNGKGSITDLCAKYDITSHSTLQNWILIKCMKLKMKHLYVMQLGTIYDSIQKSVLKIDLTVKLHSKSE